MSVFESILEPLRRLFSGGFRVPVPYREVEQTLIATVTVPANQAVNSLLMSNITTDPMLPAQQRLSIPKGEYWVIEDLYVTASPSVDGIVRFKVNDQYMGATNPLSTYNVNNPARPRIKPLTLKEFDTLVLEYVNTQAGGSAATTVTYYLKVRRYIPLV
jgi:hypothetical protein